VRIGVFVLAAVFALAAAGAARAPAAGSDGLERLVGARLVVGMQGTTPTPALLERIRRGRVGGVILMGANVRTAPQVRALTSALRAAARPADAGS
jgi:beta-N-acetylhexosaminidase